MNYQIFYWKLHSSHILLQINGSINKRIITVEGYNIAVEYSCLTNTSSSMADIACQGKAGIEMWDTGHITF